MHKDPRCQQQCYCPKYLRVARKTLNRYFRLIKKQPDFFYKRVRPEQVEKIMFRIYQHKIQAKQEIVGIENLGNLVNKLALITKQYYKSNMINRIAVNY